MRVDIMVDIETLGKSPENPMIQLGAVFFDINTGEVDLTIDMPVKPNPKEWVDMETLKWWLSTDATLLTRLLSEGNYSEAEALERFFQTIKLYQGDGIEVYLWGNGILFDNAIIQSKAKMYGIKYPIFYRNDRDVRTLVDLYCKKTGESQDSLRAKFKADIHEHDALEDCLAQVRMVTHCYNAVVGEPQ